MSILDLSDSGDPPASIMLESQKYHTAARSKRKLTNHRRVNLRLREALTREHALLRQKDNFIHQQEILSAESDHRLLNNLQMIASLLSLQSRASINTEAASQLAVAASRVGMIGRVHRRLHSLDGLQTVAFKQFLEDFCREFSEMVFAEKPIVVEGIEVQLSSATAIPLGFIVNELLTNAAKYGKDRIAVRLEPALGKGYALSVANDGLALPEGFDPASSTGMGMKIIRSFVERIHGELRIGRGDRNQGARFTVVFS